MNCPNCKAELKQVYLDSNCRYCFNCGWQGWLLTSSISSKDQDRKLKEALEAIPELSQALEDYGKRSYEIFDELPAPLVSKLRDAGFQVSIYGEKRLSSTSTVIRW